ncbi:expressed unknown protein [Seminavis robusta]|uniref:Uncharacterized protein n=1 Tax=Seminavis robusta TaxID=568900 RepID=A0A9N8DUF1_9STRA|nr:expressed unknown protein [Seminavis robusta]|eukprot:Sro288_g108820.1 n/a (478) ;mRNA; r:46365-47893
MIWGLLLIFLVEPVSAFAPYQYQQTPFVHQQYGNNNKGLPLLVLSAKDDAAKEEEEEPPKKENPYNDPNYPDLEFVDYSDPEYQVDQGIGDEFFDPTSTEAQIEEMREDRRRRNDEFQFQTYFQDLLTNGREYKGEWAVYQTSTFMDQLKDKVDAVHGLPRLLKSSRPLYVTSKAYKSTVETTSQFPTDAERIHHVETVAETNPYSNNSDDDDDDEITSQAEEELNQVILQSTYWPEPLSALDFRGEKGTMCVGAAYTICNCVALGNDDEVDGMQGPFAEYRAEMGILDSGLRFRVKLDYRIQEDAKEEFLKSSSQDDAVAPPLCLKSMVVCREMLEQWPPTNSDASSDDDESQDLSSASDQAIDNVFYGTPGAPGGLYDPPPVGSEDQAGKYMLLDLDGGATILFPYEMQQDPAAFDGNGWVTSLDWTPGRYRFQADRKVQGGLEIRNLRTLELSEVQSADADQYRPRDGGSDMRQ